MMNDPFTLIDACCEAYDQVYRAPEGQKNPPFQPRDGKTFCNQAVWFIAGRLGYHGFMGKNANEMLDVMRDDPAWHPTTLAEAQVRANAGALVVAGWHGNPHGHVCVVRPGCSGVSGKWGGPVPKVVQIGADNFIGLPMNYVAREIPQLFVWVPA